MRFVPPPLRRARRRCLCDSARRFPTTLRLLVPSQPADRRFENAWDAWPGAWSCAWS